MIDIFAISRASTRPQRLAVEIGAEERDHVNDVHGFNEATAISCGDPSRCP